MSQVPLRVYKETSLPASLAADSIYFVAAQSNPSLVEVYVTDSAGTLARHVLSESDVAGMIASAMTGGNQLFIVANIAARDALLPLAVAKWVYVVDATADNTVTTGGATYLYNPATESWVKASESESMDLVLQWSNVQGRPTSTPAAIDAAVSASHTHANAAALAKVGEDAGGNLTYGGALPVARWENAAW